MSAPPRVHLAVLQPEAIRAPGDALRCEPFSAIVPARTCVARRRETYVGGRSQHGPGERHYAYLTCRQCAVGEAIEARLRAPDVVELCAVDGCGVDVHGARGRRPLCPRHRLSQMRGRVR